MKKNYSIFSNLIVAAGLMFYSFSATAGYVTVPCTGFNADVVANGIGSAPSSTDSTFDAAGWYLLDSTYRFTAGGAAPLRALSPSGLIHSVVAGTPNLNFQLESFSAANSMRIPTSNSPRTLSFITPTSAAQVFLLGATGSGAATMTVVVNFTDGSNQTFTSQSLPDWFAGTNFAIQGIGRVNPANTQPTGTGAALDPRLYQRAMVLSAANYTKLISGITVTQTTIGTPGVINIMAVSIETPPLGIERPSLSTTKMNIYPNPVQGDFYVELNGVIKNANEKMACKIYNMIGETVYNNSLALLEENKLFIQPETKLAPGIYILETSANNKRNLQKFVVK